jgi:hypothetical protein
MSETTKQVLAAIGIGVFGIAEVLLVITLIALVCR